MTRENVAWAAVAFLSLIILFQKPIEKLMGRKTQNDQALEEQRRKLDQDSIVSARCAGMFQEVGFENLSGPDDPAHEVERKRVMTLDGDSITNGKYIYYMVMNEGGVSRRHFLASLAASDAECVLRVKGITPAQGLIVERDEIRFTAAGDLDLFVEDKPGSGHYVKKK